MQGSLQGRRVGGGDGHSGDREFATGRRIIESETNGQTAAPAGTSPALLLTTASTSIGPDAELLPLADS